jgi:ABC-2 type transport system permease protein
MPLRIAASLPIVAVALATLGTGRFTHDPLLLALFPLTVVGAWLITFLAMAVIGALAFAIDSSSSVFELWLGLYGVFSGYLIPLELFPRWLELTAKVLPFRFMLSFPVELVIGMTPRAEALRELALQWTYVAVLAVAARVTWRLGLRRFAAFGG